MGSTVSLGITKEHLLPLEIEMQFSSHPAGSLVTTLRVQGPIV